MHIISYLNGLIELINDVMNAFEVFSDDDVQNILDRTLEALEEQIKQYGSIEKYREHLSVGLKSEQTVAALIKVVWQ
ncbi:hypothetical protein [Ruminiclostridium cellobioparum]|uniref:hypothetical protein n=1 Tax=Ruminiclostridium cellobioparum TaxID=29355 RepID=UPI000349FC2F|nr:hypothetical protein [Ruminiclostridium cellobioparum]